jgi:hypothetical protein
MVAAGFQPAPKYPKKFALFKIVFAFVNVRGLNDENLLHKLAKCCIQSSD